VISFSREILGQLLESLVVQLDQLMFEATKIVKLLRRRYFERRQKIGKRKNAFSDTASMRFASWRIRKACPRGSGARYHDARVSIDPIRGRRALMKRYAHPKLPRGK